MAVTQKASEFRLLVFYTLAEASKLVSKKRNISHWSAVSELDSFCQKHVIYNVWNFIRLKNTWLLQYLVQTSEPQRSFLYIIWHYNALALFYFILIYILRSHELCPLTDHIFNSRVYVWFIWIILVAVHRQKWMTLKMALFLYNKLKQGISCWTRCETSNCNESQHFGRCYSFYDH